MEYEQGFSRLSRRSFLAGAAATLGAAALAACGGSGSGGNVTLRWAMWSASADERAVWEELAKDVNKKFPNITVKLETASFGDYFDKLQTQIASGTQSDIVSMQSLRMPGFAARHAMQSLQPFIAKDPSVNPSDFYKSISDGLSFKNEIYAFGYDVGPILLYYNKDLFKAAGVPFPDPTTPMSWDQFREISIKLSKPASQQYGYVIQPGFDSVVPWLWSGGGDYMNDGETICTLDTADAKAAMQFVVDLILKDKAAAPITDLANTQFQSERFFSGKVGMMADGPWQFVNVRSSAKFDWDIAPLPAGKAGSVTWVAGSGFGISSATKHADEAWKALTVITSKESLEKVGKSGRGYPARASAVSSIANPSLKPEHVDVVQKILSGQIAKTRFYRTTTTWQETEVMLTQEFSPIFLGQRSIDDMVARVKPKFDDLLKKHQGIVNG
ncbi:MAG: sugar ABC transporter substrate-binding protein [Ktedonobacteraceae bacterium]|nr:sugar ABC transporter substrate-binding protein [Ktedonobacteraceae bacterium]